MNRACAVIITVGGLLVATCAFAGEGGPAALTARSQLWRPATQVVLTTRRIQYPVVSVATRVVTLPRAQAFAPTVRTYVVRAAQAGPVVALPVRTEKLLADQDETTAPKS